MAATETIPRGAKNAAQMLLTGFSLARIRHELTGDGGPFGSPLVERPLDAGEAEAAIRWALAHHADASTHQHGIPPVARPHNLPVRQAAAGPYYARVEPLSHPYGDRRAYVVTANGGLLATLVPNVPGSELPPDGTARLLASSWTMRQTLERVLVWLTRPSDTPAAIVAESVVAALLESGAYKPPLLAALAGATGAGVCGNPGEPLCKTPITEDSRRRLREHADLVLGPADGPERQGPPEPAFSPSGPTAPAGAPPAEPGPGQNPPPEPPSAT